MSFGGLRMRGLAAGLLLGSGWGCSVPAFEAHGKECGPQARCPTPYLCLIAPATNMPVCLRPGEDARAFEPEDDATVTAASVAVSSSLVVQNDPLAISTVWFRFVVADLGGRVVQRAALRVRNFGAISGGVYSLRASTGPEWSEASLTPTTPGPTEAPIRSGKVTIVPPKEILELDVTDGVTGEGQWTLVMEADAALNNRIEFSSREQEYPPRLVLVLGPER